MEQTCYLNSHQIIKYKSRRLQEAFIFLKSISSKNEENNKEQVLSCQDENLKSGISKVVKEDDITIQDDPSLLLLVRNVSLKKPNLLHSASVTTAVNVEDELKNRVWTEADNLLSTRDLGVLRSKSTVETSKEYQVNQFIRVTNPEHFVKSEKKLLNRRIVFMTHHQVPLHLMSVVPYQKRVVNEKRISSTISSSQHAIVHLNNGDFIENIEFSSNGKTEVSYSHLLVPESWKRKADTFENIEEEASSLEYESVVLDDPELTSGKHRTVLNLPSFMTSIISYAKPSEVKKDINGRFKEKFPQVTITLTKLRSIKEELLQISTKMSLDPAVLACSYLYFEKVILKTKITKQNRKCIAGACLLLSIKFFDDFQSKNISIFIEAITDQLRLSLKDLLSCELQVLILLEFALLTKLHDVYLTYKRLDSFLTKITS